MSENYMKQATQNVNKAVKEAIKRTRTRMELPNNKDLIRYRSLSKDDFQELEQKYGRDEVVRYIEAMEKRALTDKGG